MKAEISRGTTIFIWGGEKRRGGQMHGCNEIWQTFDKFEIADYILFFTLSAFWWWMGKYILMYKYRFESCSHLSFAP